MRTLIQTPLFPLPILAAVLALNLGSKGGCSVSPECAAAKARVALDCKEGGDPDRCKAAMEFEVEMCSPAPAPTPTPCPSGTVAVPDGFGGKTHCEKLPDPPTCADGFPPGPDGCPKPPILNCPKGEHVVCRTDASATTICGCEPDAPPADLDIPHGEGWTGPTAALPRLVETINATLHEVFACASQDCVIGDGSDTIGVEAGWLAYDAAQVRVVEALRAKGIRSGFHEPHHTDELCAYPAGAEFCEGYKVITDGGKLKVAFAGTPGVACAGPDCRKVGGGSYRGNWTFVGVPEPARACADPRPSAPIAKVKPKLFNVGVAKVTLDVAFLFGPDPAYCKAAGWTDGRQFCPVRPEGAPDLEACEVEFVRPVTWVATIDGDSPAPGFLYVVPKNSFVVGRVETFTACARTACASGTVTKNADGTFTPAFP